MTHIRRKQDGERKSERVTIKPEDKFVSYRGSMSNVADFDKRHGYDGLTCNIPGYRYNGNRAKPDVPGGNWILYSDGAMRDARMDTGPMVEPHVFDPLQLAFLQVIYFDERVQVAKREFDRIKQEVESQIQQNLKGQEAIYPESEIQKRLDRLKELRETIEERKATYREYVRAYNELDPNHVSDEEQQQREQRLMEMRLAKHAHNLALLDELKKLEI